MANTAIRKNDEQHLRLYKDWSQGIYIHRDWEPLFINPKFADILGYKSPDEIYALGSLDNHLAPHERNRLSGYADCYLKGNAAPFHFQYEAVRKDGSRVVLQNVVWIVEWEGHSAIQCMVMEVSERRRVAERRRSEKALRDSGKALRFLSNQLIEVQENERKRIASELHDGVSQSLTAIKYSLENSLKSGEALNPKSFIGIQKNVVQKIQETIEELRRISTNLRPAMLDSLGILSTIDWLARENQELNPGLKIVKRYQVEEKQIPDTLKVVIYRVIQEALNNAVKHADAKSVLIELDRTGYGIRLTIKDDGQGFKLTQAITVGFGSSGFGLNSMRERAESSGGFFRVDSRPGAGTIIDVYWPATLVSKLRRD